LSNWLAYDDFVDLVRNHHHDAFTGLITGVSDSKHSFQIGFRAGQVVLLTYRILKGSAALEKLVQIDRAKITEHPNTEVPSTNSELPETSSILSRLTMESEEEKHEITDVVIPSSDVETTAVDITAPVVPSNPQTTLDNNQIKKIKTAAIHHFGPIGAMVCEEYLSTSNLSNNDLGTLLRRIAEEVGASSSDTQAFLISAS
jgi:hypothetical protein